MRRQRFGTCTLCEAMCGVAITVDGDQVADIRGDREDPLSRGHICPKAVALKDVHEDPDRLRRPLIRRGEGFEEVTWERAFDEVEAGLGRVIERHGSRAIAIYQGNPTVHSLGAMLYGQLLFRAIPTGHRYSATSLDQLPHMLASLQMFGHQLLLPVPDVDRTAMMLILGANPVVSNGSMMTAPGIAGRLKAIRARGGRVVLIDPRRTETAAIADRHLFIAPGMDALLLAALVRTVLEERGPRLRHLEGACRGLDRLRAALAGFAPEAVEGATRVTACEIRRLAGELWEAPSAVVYGRVGVSTQRFGGLCQWLIIALNAVTGNLDRPGGAMFAKPAIDVVRLADLLGSRGSFDRRRSRVRRLPEFGGELPVAALAEEMETPGEGRIRALLTLAGNPVLSAPNGARIERALPSLDFMVAIDIYLNETTRHARVILPPAFALERAHYDLVFHALAVRNTAKYSEAFFPKPPDARHEWEILLELHRRLAPRTPANLLAERLLRRGPELLLDLGLRSGPYGSLVPGRRGLSLAVLKAAPHGVDLGPLEPCLPDRLRTPDKSIDLAPEVFVKDLERLGREIRRAPGDGLLLIGRRELRSNNSWLHNSARMMKGKPRCTLHVHPDDAARLGLGDEARARVTSRVGAIEAEVHVTDAIAPGVVSLPHGYGHHREGMRLSVASEHAGVSINDLTDESEVDTLAGTAHFSGVPVTIQPL